VLDERGEKWNNLLDLFYHHSDENTQVDHDQGIVWSYHKQESTITMKIALVIADQDPEFFFEKNANFDKRKLWDPIVKNKNFGILSQNND
jgi:hypothetical protein